MIKIRRYDFPDNNTGTRAFNAIRRERFETWNDLDGECECRFLDLPAFGPRTLETLRKVAHHRGVRIRYHYDHDRKELPTTIPTQYMGVKVDEVLRRNWGQPEAEWWRRGVSAALSYARTGVPA